MSEAARSVYVVGIGKPLGWGGTLTELEADVQRVREMGAPDDAVVSRAVPGSIYAAEVVWIGDARV